jgi:2-desacetyl-2-hydroxyethyl bacteriochlorophyllide A dehydrogenase
VKAIQIINPGKIEIVETPLPPIGKGEVLVRILKVGLCGTDLHLYEGHFGNFPIVPGHDAAGVVEKVGEGVSSDLIGTRVTLDPASCCLRAATHVPLCGACSKGETHLCSYRTYMGIDAPGAMSEFIIVSERRAIPLPEEMDDVSATILEPVAVALHLIEKISDRFGRTLIIGGGPIGILCALLLQDAHYQVWLVEPLENRRTVATQLGVQHVLSPFQLDHSPEFQILVEASGHPSAADTIIKKATPGSTIVLIGGGINIPGELILLKELEVRAVKGGRGLYPEAISWTLSKKINLRLLISHTFPAREAAEAFRFASQNRLEVTRVVLDMTKW